MYWFGQRTQQTVLLQ